MTTEIENKKAQFISHLQRALTALYDPVVLRNSPLTELFGLEQGYNTVSVLRRMLTEAIESLRPNASTPQDSRTWRVYQILRRRYTEQVTQREVAVALGLSVRQLQREEKLAREVLADHLWVMHDLADKAQSLSQETPATEDPSTLSPSRAQELEYLRSSVPPRMITITTIIDEIVETLSPLLSTSGVTIAREVQDNIPQLLLRETLLRQAILNILSAAVHQAQGGQVQIEVSSAHQDMMITIQAVAKSQTTSAVENKDVAPPGDTSANNVPSTGKSIEGLTMARQLIELCEGSLSLSPPRTMPFVADITLPIAEQATVLVIDDNADVLHLFKRYLDGSRYRFVAARNAQQGLELAETTAPRVIVLDVMMPGSDGWNLLGQLREHPKTRDVPVIVCTILSQEQLALALGAADFIRKPVNRSAFLQALDRHLARP